MQAVIPGVHISGIAAALPNDIFEVMSLQHLSGEKKMKRTIAGTGVERTHTVGKGDTTADLCAFASECLFARLSAGRAGIDAVVFVSGSPDYAVPATSAALQDRLGLRRDALIYDINHGCSAYIYGIYQAAMLIKSSGCGRVLVCVGDTPSLGINMKDLSMKVLLGDAGTATIVEKGTDTLYFVLKTDGSGYRHLFVPDGGMRSPWTKESFIDKEGADGNVRKGVETFMDGLEIMNFALKEAPPLVAELLKLRGWRQDEVDTFAFHQANKMILKYLREKMEIPAEKMPVSMTDTGNTGASTIPVLLSCEAARLTADGKLNKVVACGFGSGLSWGAFTCDLSNSLILPPLEYINSD